MSTIKSLKPVFKEAINICTHYQGIQSWAVNSRFDCESVGCQKNVLDINSFPVRHSALKGHSAFNCEKCTRYSYSSLRYSYSKSTTGTRIFSRQVLDTRTWKLRTRLHHWFLCNFNPLKIQLNKYFIACSALITSQTTFFNWRPLNFG